MANCAPCGDACILGVDPGAGEDDHSVFCCTTGAKLVSTQVHSEQSLQTTGMLRRKPGRGDATFSMSCSDKIEFKEHESIVCSVARKLEAPYRLNQPVIWLAPTPPEDYMLYPSGLPAGLAFTPRQYM
ncbi:hypothetical protein SELMODRAFT_428898 [Selaginella moellendorffii]|uniref:tRNA-specific adenosine deaminase 1 n=1 Tax=Selaginella moellendorffii TaxID=88036 RepID=D8T4C8_SELML|nr:hypothetical protein SELMODRAFT_428898 [Selaginella moellendorffii]